MKNLCDDCSKETRGLCCCINLPINGFNLILENVPCHFLDLDTMKCSVYDNRKKIASWCLKGEKLFGHGALPEGCLYLEGHPEREPNPKRLIKDVLSELPEKEQAILVGLYNTYNNIPFSEYEGYLVK